MTRKRDLDFEALARVTNANVEIERGRLNTALRAIKAAWHQEGGHTEDLHEEIPRRAVAYRKMFPKMTLTPTALAVHWHRVIAQQTDTRRESKQLIDEMRRENERSEQQET